MFYTVKVLSYPFPACVISTFKSFEKRHCIKFYLKRHQKYYKSNIWISNSIGLFWNIWLILFSTPGTRTRLNVLDHVDKIENVKVKFWGLFIKHFYLGLKLTLKIDWSEIEREWIKLTSGCISWIKKTPLSKPVTSNCSWL